MGASMAYKPREAGEEATVKRRQTRIGLFTGLLAAGALWSSAGPASANTATMGSALTETSDANLCTAPCLAVQENQAGGSSPHPLRSPANGVLVEWAIVSTDNVTFALRILRPDGPHTYTDAGTVLAPTPDPNPPAPAPLVLRYPASLKIERGDAIGIYAVGGDSDAGVPQSNTPGTPSNVWATNDMGQPIDGGTAPFTPEAGHELLLQATVRFCSVPSLKRLKKATAKEQLAASDCGVKVKRRPTNKRKFRGRVLKQKVEPGTTAVPGRVVTIVIGRK
jgi:PASTA domain